MKKLKRAVIVGLEMASENKLRITLDDAIQSGREPSEWIKDVSITSKEYDRSTFQKLDFGEKELADFGYHILARIHAFYGQGET